MSDLISMLGQAVVVVVLVLLLVILLMLGWIAVRSFIDTIKDR